MIQDVKLSIHKIGNYMYAISKCSLSFGNSVLLVFRRKSSKSRGCGKGSGHK